MSIDWDVRVDWDSLLINEADAIRAARDAMEHVREVAVERTPIEYGTLRQSAKVTATEDGAKVTFDGPYARYQHERLDLRHPRGGQAKYLESAVLSEKDTAIDIIRRKLIG